MNPVTQTPVMMTTVYDAVLTFSLAENEYSVVTSSKKVRLFDGQAFFLGANLCN